MKREDQIEKLKWDTNFFGFNVGKIIINNKMINDVLVEFEQSAFNLIYKL